MDVPPNCSSTSALGVSADGRIVVGYGFDSRISDAGELIPAIWTPETQALPGFGPYAGLVSAGANAISANGVVVVGACTSFYPTSTAFRWTKSGGMQDLGSLAFGSSMALGVSADGSTIVGQTSLPSGGYGAFKWTAKGGMVDIGNIGGLAGVTTANGVSADGTRIVGVSNGHAFLWTAATGMTDLGYEQGFAISGDGSTVVGGLPFGDQGHAFRWTSGGGRVSLGELPGDFYSAALAASGDGSIIVGWSQRSGAKAVIWTSTGIEDLNVKFASRIPPGWVLVSANGITPDGRYIVGSAYVGNNGRGFRLYCGP